jgi:hypothetical protein
VSSTGAAYRPLDEQRERLLEHPQLRAGRAGVDLERLSQRTKGIGERLVRQIRADEIDRPAEQHLKPRVTSTLRELGREPGLADAGFAGDEHRRTAPGPRRVEDACKLRELPSTPDEYLARQSHHSGQYHTRLGGRDGAVSTPTGERKEVAGQG